MPKSLSLPDRVLAALPRLSTPTVSEMAAHINFDIPRIRAAFDMLEASGRAKIVRRGNGLHLLPANDPTRICPVCRAEVTAKAKHVRCCSKTCSSRFMWRTRDRAAQSEVMRASRTKGADKMLASNIASHQTPEYRARHAERNRRDWADPQKRMKRVLGMEAAWQGPQADARRANARAQRLARWDAPGFREAAVAAMQTGKRGRYQRALIAMVAEGAEAEEIAARSGRTVEQTKLLWRRCYRLGLVSRPPQDGRKMRPVRPKRSAHV